MSAYAIIHHHWLLPQGVLRNFAKFTRNHLCQSLFFNKVAVSDYHFIKKETLSHVFSWEFCKFSKSTFSERPPLVDVSENIFTNISEHLHEVIHEYIFSLFHFKPTFFLFRADQYLYNSQRYFKKVVKNNVNKKSMWHKNCRRLAFNLTYPLCRFNKFHIQVDTATIRPF